MEYKQAGLAMVKDIDGRDVTGIASVFGNIDDGGDIVHRGAFKKTLKEQKDRIRHLWQHDFWSPPIATIMSLQEVGKDALPQKLQKRDDVTGGLEVRRRYLTNERAEEIFEGISTGAINEMSFAFNPQKYDFDEVDLDDEKTMRVRNIRELRLWETSDVIWGMNALTSASKNWLPARKTGHLAKDAEWFEPTLDMFTDQEWDQLPDQEKDRIAQHFAWTDTTPVQKFEDLRYAHHKPSKQGVGPLVYAGLKDALKRFLDDPSGILEVGTAKVYDHLGAHLEEYGEKALSMELYALSWVLDSVIKQGTLPEGELLGILDEAYSMTREFIETAESPKADRALTEALTAKLRRSQATAHLMSMKGRYSG